MDTCRIISDVPETAVFEVNKALRADAFIFGPPEVLAWLRSGGPPELDCLLGLLGGRMEPSRLGDRVALAVYLEARIEPSQLAIRLGELEGVEQVTLPLPLGTGIPLACIFEREGARYYRLSLALSGPSLPSPRRHLLYRATDTGLERLVDVAVASGPMPPELELPECR